MENNVTSGNLLKHIAFFAIPYLLSYFLQTLYGMVDLFIVGQFNAVDGITAVSNGSQVMHMLTAILVGLAMGVTVSISHAVGAENHTLVERTIGNTITLFACISIVSTFFIAYFCKTTCRVTQCSTRSNDWNCAISYHLFYRDPLHYSL